MVRYAAARHITIVPEIDVPGHAQAAVAAYPELGVTGKQIHVLNEWGVNTDLFNTEESTFAFLENVLAEVVDLFPGTYVHVGGDEAVKDQWKASARVQAAHASELGVKDEAGMQSLPDQAPGEIPGGARPPPDRLGRNPGRRPAGGSHGDVLARHRRRHRRRPTRAMTW